MQPFGHNRCAPKIGERGFAPPLGEAGWVPIEHKVTWADAYLRTKWRLDACSRLVTIKMGRKLSVPCLARELGPHLAQ